MRHLQWWIFYNRGRWRRCCFVASLEFLPHRKSTTSNAIPCCWQRSLTGSNTSSISLFLSTRVSVKVELRNIRIVFCTSLGSMMSERTSLGPASYKWKESVNGLAYKHISLCYKRNIFENVITFNLLARYSSNQRKKKIVETETQI